MRFLFVLLFAVTAIASRSASIKDIRDASLKRLRSSGLSAETESIIHRYDVSCASKACSSGTGFFDLYSLECICPEQELPPLWCLEFQCPFPLSPFWSYTSDECVCDNISVRFINKFFSEHKKPSTTGVRYSVRVAKDDMKSSKKPISTSRDNAKPRKREFSSTITTTPASAVDSAVPTFIPPPKVDVTDQLIDQSLMMQPQNKAVVVSTIPYFKDGVIVNHVQLDGPIADALPMNTSTSLPCGTIGQDPAPEIVLIPKYVKDGTPVKVIANCLCIAVNMYNENTITYWIQTEDGSIYSLAGRNQVEHIDQIKSDTGPYLSLFAASSTSSKRDIARTREYVTPERRQVFKVACGQPCPFYHMHQLKTSGDICGCAFNSATEELRTRKRAITEPNAYTATMTAESCKSITCINNGGKAAIFNPFTRTCWCTTPVYLDDNPSAWKGGQNVS